MEEKRAYGPAEYKGIHRVRGWWEIEGKMDGFVWFEVEDNEGVRYGFREVKNERGQYIADTKAEIEAEEGKRIWLCIYNRIEYKRGEYEIKGEGCVIEL